MVWLIRGRERPYGQSQNLGLKCWKFGTVLGNPETDFELLLVHMCCLCVKL